MEQNYTNDTFLAKWLNKDLTEQERLAFESSSDFKIYQKIIEKSDLLEAPEFSKGGIYEKIQQQINKKTKVKKLVPQWVYAAAASVAMLFGLFYFWNTDTVYETQIGQQLTVVLPDHSQVVLNAKSSLSLDEDEWKEGKRNLKLEGEGYFKVEKGSKFTVESDQGEVSVLGTQFNVKTSSNYFEVRCFEGKVKVIHQNENRLLTQGMGYRKMEQSKSEDLNFDTVVPSWIAGETTFKETPLKIVFEELEKLYPISISLENVDETKLYSGSFSNTNVKIALLTVCMPLELECEFNGKNVLVRGN